MARRRTAVPQLSYCGCTEVAHVHARCGIDERKIVVVPCKLCTQCKHAKYLYTFKYILSYELKSSLITRCALRAKRYRLWYEKCEQKFLGWRARHFLLIDLKLSCIKKKRCIFRESYQLLSFSWDDWSHSFLGTDFMIEEENETITYRKPKYKLLHIGCFRDDQQQIFINRLYNRKQ